MTHEQTNTLPTALALAAKLFAAHADGNNSSANFAAVLREAYAANLVEDVAALAIRKDFEMLPPTDAKDQSSRAGGWRTRLNKSLAREVGDGMAYAISVKSPKGSASDRMAGILPPLEIKVKLVEVESGAIVPEHVKAADALARGYEKLIASPAVSADAKKLLRNASVILQAAMLLMKTAGTQAVAAPESF